jgi:hypothetical protein
MAEMPGAREDLALRQFALYITAYCRHSRGRRMDTSNIEVLAEITEIMGCHKGGSPDALIREGVPLEALDRLAQPGIDVTHLGIINPRTLSHRRNRGEALSPAEGDRLYRAGLVMSGWRSRHPCCSGCPPRSPPTPATCSSTPSIRTRSRPSSPTRPSHSTLASSTRNPPSQIDKRPHEVGGTRSRLSHPD